eukprot:TRINITY_DN2846_c0_g5_i1.p1 TRINITY_DN2846_c0_g5~~TRINITY_DN2846_c0_g5_i1.p1  ORF type:complete len:373 (+),score=116.42 TRINITY_DN2846_c0_g5_i1:66-1184(+)
MFHIRVVFPTLRGCSGFTATARSTLRNNNSTRIVGGAQRWQQQQQLHQQQQQQQQNRMYSKEATAEGDSAEEPKELSEEEKIHQKFTRKWRRSHDPYLNRPFPKIRKKKMTPIRTVMLEFMEEYDEEMLDFLRTPVLSESTKKRMYNLYAENPLQWDELRLSHKFKIPVPNVNAILRLQALEAAEVAAGGKHDDQIERLLAKTFGEIEEPEEMEEEATMKVGKPHFEFVDEEVDHHALANIHIANALAGKKKPPSQRKPPAVPDHELPFTKDEGEEPTPVTLRPAPEGMKPSRWKWMLADVGPHTTREARKIVVVDYDRSSRTATREERLFINDGVRKAHTKQPKIPRLSTKKKTEHTVGYPKRRRNSGVFH